VLVPDNVYGQNRYLSESWLPQWGVTHRFYDPLTVPELRRHQAGVAGGAGSITLEFPDLLGTLAACRERGVLTALDNTWGRSRVQRLRAGAGHASRPGGRHRGAGADQIPQRRRGRADGLGLHPRSVAARPPELRPRTPRLRSGPERRGAGAAACPRCRCATPRRIA
jgi:hypothetical protein